MKLTKINNNNRDFLLWKVCGLLLLLVGISVKSFGQIYIGENVTLSIQKGTNFHISESRDDKSQTARIYVAENAKIINLSKHVLVTVSLKREKQSLKDKTLAKNKSKKPLPLPIVKRDTEPENGTGVLSFSSIPKTPSTIFYFGRSTQVALAQNISTIKFFPEKKYYSIAHSKFLNRNRQIKISSIEFLLLPQHVNIEDHITRPPPFQV